MPEDIIPLLKDYRKSISDIFGYRLQNIILFGSYARGDFKQGSDVDIMILADIPPEEVSCYADQVYDITYEFETEYDFEINPCVQNVQVFDKWKNTYPFYISIAKDGIEI